MGTSAERPNRHHEPTAAISDKASFAASFDALLTTSRLSLRELAARAGTSASTISSWRNARHLPYPRQDEVVVELLTELGVDDAQPWLDGLAAARADFRRPVGQNPYRGLAPFTESDIDVFFGREDLVDELWDRARDQLAAGPTGPTVLVGASGSGKTSALRAGLCNRLEANGFSNRYLTAESSPQLHQALRSSPTEEATSEQVLIIDQFEAVLSDSMALSSEAVLSVAQQEAEGRVVVIGLRADHYHLGLEHEYLARGLRHPVIPDVMDDDRIADVIELPAQAANLSVDPELTHRLLADFGEQVRSGRVGEILPLLSHVLYTIVERPDGAVERNLTLARYHEVGGLEGALRTSAEELYSDLDEEGREVCRRVFPSLVEVGRDGLPLRRRAPLAGLLAAPGSDGEGSSTEKVVEAFVSHRLLTVERETVTISHEALLRAWPRLAGWIDEYRDSLAALRRIRSAHEAWLANDRDTGSLLAGAGLEIANDLTRQPLFTGQLTEAERSYISTSHEAASRRARSRRRLFRAAVGSALVATVLLAVTTTFFIQARRSSAEAVSRQLSLQSLNLAESEPALSAQLAVAAHAVASTVESRSSVIAASGQMPSARYPGQPGATGLALSEDGSRIAYSDSVDGRIVVLERADDPRDSGGSYREIAALTLEDPDHDVYGLDISPDGSLVAYGGTDFYANIWDLETDETMVLDDTLTNYQGAVQEVLFNLDGTEVIASGTSEGGVGRWEVARGPTQSTKSLIPAAGSVMAIATDADMTTLATGNDNGEVRLWALDAPQEPIWSHTAEGSPSALTVAINPTGDMLAVGFRDGTFEVWDISDRTAPSEVTVEAEPFGSWTTAVSFSPSERRLVAASADGQAQVWDTRGWTPLGDPISHPNGVTDAELIDDHSLVVALADGSVRTWGLDHPQMMSLGAPIWSATFTTDGASLLATSKERSVLWQVTEAGELRVQAADLRSPEPDRQFTGESRFSPDGRTVAAGTFDGDVLIMSLTDDQQFETERVLGGLESLVEALEYSPDGSLLAALGNRGELTIWDLDSADSEPVAAQTRGSILFNLAFAPDGSLLAVTDSEGQLNLFEVGSNGELSERSVTQIAPDSASGVMFHPSEPVLAIGSHDTSVSLWNIADPAQPRLVTRLSGPSGRVHDVGFTPAGDRLGASISDGTAWIWDVDELSEPELLARIVDEGQMYTLTFSPSAELLIGAGTAQTITAWRIDQNEAVKHLCADIGTPITEAEWTDLVPGVDYDPPC